MCERISGEKCLEARQRHASSSIDAAIISPNHKRQAAARWLYQPGIGVANATAGARHEMPARRGGGNNK